MWGRQRARGSIHRVRRLLAEMLRAHRRSYPNRIAVHCRLGEISYADLNQAADRLAHRIIDWGGRVGDRVAILIPQDRRIFIAMLAALKAGRIVLVLNGQDPHARIAQLLDDAEPIILLTIERCLAEVREIAGSRVSVVDVDAVLGDGPRRARGSTWAPTTSPTSLHIRLDRSAERSDAKPRPSHARGGRSRASSRHRSRGPHLACRLVVGGSSARHQLDYVPAWGSFDVVPGGREWYHRPPEGALSAEFNSRSTPVFPAVLKIRSATVVPPVHFGGLKPTRTRMRRPVHRGLFVVYDGLLQQDGCSLQFDPRVIAIDCCASSWVTRSASSERPPAIQLPVSRNSLKPMAWVPRCGREMRARQSRTIDTSRFTDVPSNANLRIVRHGQ